MWTCSTFRHGMVIISAAIFDPNSMDGIAARIIMMASSPELYFLFLFFFLLLSLFLLFFLLLFFCQPIFLCLFFNAIFDYLFNPEHILFRDCLFDLLYLIFLFFNLCFNYLLSLHPDYFFTVYLNKPDQLTKSLWTLRFEIFVLLHFTHLLMQFAHCRQKSFLICWLSTVKTNDSFLQHIQHRIKTVVIGFFLKSGGKTWIDRHVSDIKSL